MGVETDVDASTLTGKFIRTVHTSYDIFVGPPECLPDMNLKPADNDKLTVLSFRDRIDGEHHYYVLNEEFRKAILEGLTGGVIIGDTFPDAFPRNGRSG